jgi:hypothetical protein
MCQLGLLRPQVHILAKVLEQAHNALAMEFQTPARLVWKLVVENIMPYPTALVNIPPFKLVFFVLPENNTKNLHNDHY